jgi:hypothetical protein
MQVIHTFAARWILLTIATISSLAAFTEVFAAAQDLRPIYDARKLLEPTKASAAAEALLKRTILPVADQYWDWEKKDKDCDVEFQVIDVTQGSFTKTSSTQKAILYKYCTTGHNFALNGIAVLEESRVVAHIVYEGSWDHAIGALPDIDGNGLSEILIATGGTNMGETWEVISVIELSEHSVRKFGQTETFLDNCGADEKKGDSTAYKLWVKPGTIPGFYRETFFKKGCSDNGKWLKLGTQKQILFRKDEVN